MPHICYTNLMFPKQSTHGVVLAPMEGVTDAPFRNFLTKLTKYDYCVTEFIRISNSIPRPARFIQKVPELKNNCKTEAGTLLQIQLLGGDTFNLTQSAINAVQAGAIAIDINFGCPAPVVNRHDGGANLLKSPKRIFEILNSIRKALPNHVAVSAKMRLGWDSTEPILENAKAAEDAGVNWITIHARTKAQFYKSPVHWDKISEVKKLLSIPIVANGDIWSFEDFLKCREITGCSHFMLGRGALANPMLATQINNYFKMPSNANVSISLDWLKTFNQYTSFNSKIIHNPNYSLRKMKQWIALSKPAGTLLWASELLRSKNLEDFKHQCAQLCVK